MRTLVTYTLLIFLSVVSAHAQGMKKLTQLQDFEKRLAEEAQTVQSIESDFTQVKYLDIFDEKVTSKGSSTTRRAIKSAWNISARWTISS